MTGWSLHIFCCCKNRKLPKEDYWELLDECQNWDLCNQNLKWNISFRFAHVGYLPSWMFLFYWPLLKRANADPKYFWEKTFSRTTWTVLSSVNQACIFYMHFRCAPQGFIYRFPYMSLPYIFSVWFVRYMYTKFV